MSEAKEVPIKCQIITPSLLVSSLKLFKALPIKNQKKQNPTQTMSELTIGNGFIFDPKVVANYSNKELHKLIDVIANEIGISPEAMNATFHKSWKKVRDAPYFQLLSEQAFHYMTTYGYERMGVFDEATVYIPNERLDVPEITDGIKLVVIRGYTTKQLKEKLLKILNSGIALKSIDEVVEIAKYIGLTDDEVLALNNKEVRVRLYQELDLIPANPVEFLRLAVFEAIDRTLLINNKASVELIKASEKDLSDLFLQYDENFGYKRLAEIFNRFKPLFMAFKNEKLIPTINLISHLSKKYHKPMKSNLLNNITGMLKRGDKISPARLNEALGNVNIFRKIRLCQSLAYRASGNKSIMYKIRNGKAFATTMEFDNIEGAKKIYSVILDSIAKDLKHLKGKEFFIPENLTYALPATEKQFSGNMPSGSYITIPKDMIFGVWWTNTNHHRIDLDLHAIALNGGTIGWDSSYRTENALFSGDITDAPKGATELVYIDKNYEDTILLTLNYYNFREDTPVPFKIIVAEEHPNSFGKNYTIDPNHIRSVVNSVINVSQKVIGLGTVKDGECRFYFTENDLGNTISVRGHAYMTFAREYLAGFATTQVTLNEVLEKVGAKIVHEPTKKSIDLSPEALERDTFINLLIK